MPAGPSPSITNLAPPVDAVIREIRGHRVILDTDLATLYGVPTFRLNEAVKRNRRRFPADFMFQLTKKEADALTSQFAFLDAPGGSTSQSAMSKRGRGQHRKYLPYAFTEHGALQAANVLKSERAAAMSLYVIRAFVHMRAQLSEHSDVLRRLAEMDRKLMEHDDTLAAIWMDLQPLLNPSPEPPKRRIGFHHD